jgi:hypothetical protein
MIKKGFVPSWHGMPQEHRELKIEKRETYKRTLLRHFICA